MRPHPYTADRSMQARRCEIDSYGDRVWAEAGLPPRPVPPLERAV